MNWNRCCMFVGTIWVAFSAAFVNLALSNNVLLWRCAAGILAAVLLLVALLAFYMSILPCSEYHTLGTLLKCFFRNSLDALRARRTKATLYRMWRNPRKAQESLLAQFTARDTSTEYGRLYRLSEIKTLADLQAKHPLVDYEHYRAFVQRLANGEQGVFLGEPIERFGITTGTTGVGKLIPQAASRKPHILRLVIKIFAFSVNECFGTPSPLQRMCIFYCMPTLNKTKSGHVMAPVIYIDQKDSDVIDLSNTPKSGFLLSTDFESNYVHLLFALRDKYLDILCAPFTSLIFRGMKLIEEHKDTFLIDIALGKLNPDLAIPSQIRRDLEAALTPNPKRADELRAEFSKGFVGIVSRIWPHLKYMYSIDVGGFKLKLQKYFAKGTPIYSGFYGCTESKIGINLWPGETPAKYALYLIENVVEFIPEDKRQEKDVKTLLVDEVEVGKSYEIVLTTVQGLYRYRNGDVIEVVGFHEKCPIVQFKYRTAELLNLRGEKVSAVTMQAAVEELISELPGTKLISWTTAESSLLAENKGGDGYQIFYLVFLELETMSSDTSGWSTKFDHILRNRHHDFNYLRDNRTMAMAHVHQVESGSFDKLQDYIIANSSASVNQFKMPKKLRRQDTLELMMSHII